ncbi:MAG: 50S ribosomal protein L17 [Bacteroidota bacterium]
MRHGKKFNHLSRTSSHRKAMLSNMASSLISNKRITTTVAKAKALRKYIEPIMTKAKVDSTHSRRVVFSYLQDKESVKTLFDEVAEKIISRPGGYTRIIKTGNRLGDNADMCIIELVDYNELLLKEEQPAKAKTTRRSRRGGSSKPASEKAIEAAPKEEVKEDVVEEPKDSTSEEESIEAKTEEAVVVAAEAEVVEEQEEAKPSEEETKKEDESSENDEDKKS